MFQVGDIITGIEEETYPITDSNAVCQVINVCGDVCIEVIIIDHKTIHDAIGSTYIVDSRYFTLLNSSIKLTAQSNDDFIKMIG